MAIGPGKYDDLCTMVREQAGIGETTEGEQPTGVIVIVLGGNRGNGFSCQTNAAAMVAMPQILESVAGDIRGSRKILGGDNEDD